MLQLDAMTLRGIGSYFRGSRLELRGLTILSGVNSSGKSTWFKTLAMLRRSSDEGKLPFAFAVDDSNPWNVGFMNYSLYCMGDLSNLSDAGAQNKEFGPPACIGLEFSVTHDFEVGDPAPVAWSAQNTEQRFLVEGLCTKGMKLRVRIAHPTGDTDTHIRPEIPGMDHHVELSINDNSLRFVRPHKGGGDNSKEIEYGFCGDPVFGNIEQPILRDLTSKRIVQLIKLFFEGYFHISAVREFHENYYAKIDAPPADSHEYRYVGYNGLQAHNVLHWNSRDRARLRVDDEPLILKQVHEALDSLLEVSGGRSLDDDEGALAKYTNLYLGGPQPPRQFSSGFHQLFPIIVQLAVMRAGEMVSIENPEVHLHPDLQLKISEYLLAQSRRGRRIIVETHSDLIIRRVVRAILAEEEGLSQQQVSLNFSTQQDSADGVGSVLQPFGVDDAGRIKWPKGFMEASINESERLMDVMYGRRKTSDSEGDE